MRQFLSFLLPGSKVLTVAFLFFCLSLRVLAARSISITSDKSSLFGEEEMTITASMSGFTPGETIYIKGAFYQEGSTNYFGYTKNGDVWIKNGDTTTSQRSVVIDSWDGKLSAKSDFSDSGYKGEGEYKVKLGYYYTTSGGSLSSVNWSGNTVTVSLNEPDPTPTPTSTSTPTPQATATSTPTITPTRTPTPTLTPSATKTPTPTPTAIPTPSATLIPSEMPMETSEPSQDVLGESTGEKTKSSDSNTQNDTWRPIVISLLLVATGCAILAGLYAWKIARAKMMENPDEE